jgi:CHAT domain-containing protein
MIGLRRACHLAGARTVISSLWSVSDDSPAGLMAGFYENLWLRGKGPLESLRAAQLRLIAERQPPAAWGAFVLSGAWR